jgi:MORN repeat variant
MVATRIHILISIFVILASIISCRDKELKQTYYENGKLETVCEMKDGRKNGLGQAYFESGALKYEGNYKEDFRDGWHTSYYPTGQVRKKIFYARVNGRELANQTLGYNKHGDLISDFRFAPKKVSVKIGNKQPYKVNDVLSVKLKIEDPKHTYLEAIFGNFDENLNILSNPQDFSDEVYANKNHEIFMKIQISRSGPDTLTWLVRDYDFKYRTDTTGTSTGEETYVSFPIEVLQ